MAKSSRGLINFTYLEVYQEVTKSEGIKTGPYKKVLENMNSPMLFYLLVPMYVYVDGIKEEKAVLPVTCYQKLG